MKLIAYFAVLVVGLTGCAGVVGGGSRSWKDQVILPDGRELIVERTNILGSKLDREFSSYNAPPPVRRYVLKIPIGLGKQAVWEANHDDKIPIAVLVDSVTAYVIASPFDCSSHARNGSLEPPFVVSKFVAGEWIPADFRDLPWSISEANILLGSGGQMAINLIEQGVVQAKGIRHANEESGRRWIYRSGADPQLWRECIGRFKGHFVLPLDKQ